MVIPWLDDSIQRFEVARDVQRHMTGTKYSLSGDPVFYATAAAFAVLTTGLPALLGQHRFMPISQAIALTAFMAVPLRRGHIQRTVTLYAVWLLIQMVVITMVTILVVDRVERAIPGGFQYRALVLNWLFAGDSLPSSIAGQPVTSLLEIVGIILGSLLTAGFLGNWFLVRAANLAGFTTGSLSLATGTFALLPLAIPIWSIIRIAGFAGMVILLSEPLLTSNWSIRYYLTVRRTLAIVAGGLFIASVLAEFVFPPTWQSLMSQFPSG